MNKIKTGIYIRVSTEEQAKTGFSIRAQKEKLISYSNLRDWEIYDIYIDDFMIFEREYLPTPFIKSLIEMYQKKTSLNIQIH